MENRYLSTAHDLYREAARSPRPGLCCTTTPMWRLPELAVPKRMLEMNYGCGSTVHPRDLVGRPSVLYVGVGGGLELLQFAYFSRRPGAVIGVDTVDEMLAACAENLAQAQRLNPWFRASFAMLRKGEALDLPVADASIDVAAQNCLFNIFRDRELERALAEMYRVLKPHGRLVLSDPVCESPLPESLRDDARLRALCLSGAMPLRDYVARLVAVGFGTIEVRARRPYRMLSPRRYALDRPVSIESVELCAIKDPVPDDGACVFTGRAVIYFGDEESFDDGKGHVMKRDQPLAVCDKTAGALAALAREDIYVSASTWFYDGGGCC